MKRHIVVLIVLVSATGACGSDGSTSTPTGIETASPSPSGAPVSPLVGEWVRVTTCNEFIRSFREAGFEESVIEENILSGLASPDNGWLPAGEQADPKHPCKGTVPREHSHFFTEFGVFGSLDHKGRQVDDDSYEIVDDRTFVIGTTTFHFEMIGEDEIMFEPVIPDDCSTKRCLGAALWSVAVAYAGETWERVD